MFFTQYVKKWKKIFFLLFWLFGAKIWLFGVDRTFYQHFCNKMDPKKKKKNRIFFWLFRENFDFLGLRWLFGDEVTNQHNPKHSTTLYKVTQVNDPGTTRHHGTTIMNHTWWQAYSSTILNADHESRNCWWSGQR